MFIDNREITGKYHTFFYRLSSKFDSSFLHRY